MQLFGSAASGQLDLFARVWCRWPVDYGPAEVESLWVWDDGGDVVCCEVAVRAYSYGDDHEAPLRLRPRPRSRATVLHLDDGGQPIGAPWPASHDALPLRLTATLARVPVAQVLRLHEQHLREQGPDAAAHLADRTASEAYARWSRTVARGVTTLERRPPTGRSDGPDLQLIAELFTQAESLRTHDVGDGKELYRPSKWVQMRLEQLARKDPDRYGRYAYTSAATVRTWIRRARERHFLPSRRGGATDQKDQG